MSAFSSFSGNKSNRRLLIILGVALLVLLLVLLIWRFSGSKKNAGTTSGKPSSSPTASTGSGQYDMYNDCDMDGTARNPRVIELNHLKNRYNAPGPEQFNRSITISSMLEEGNDRNRFDVNTAVEITGFVSDVKPGGVESCNCGAKDLLYRDTHIELVLHPMQGAELPVIVEVTPRWRAIKEKEGIDWTTNSLRRQFKGRWVKVQGWLMYDTEHEKEAENTAPGRSRNWRRTSWEIHPVTSIEVTSRPKESFGIH